MTTAGTTTSSQAGLRTSPIESIETTRTRSHPTTTHNTIVPSNKKRGSFKMHITSLLVLGALGAVTAHPSGHARFHRGLHQNPNRAENIISATINGKVVEWTQDSSPFVMAGRPQKHTTTASPTPTPTPTPASSEEPAATSTQSASSGDSDASGEGVSTYTTFSDYCGSSSKKRATLGQIMYTGNTGDGTYGCNIMKVASEAVAAKYDNTIKFYGATEDMNCWVWNKMAADGTLSGMWGTDATTFTLKAGAVQYVAFDSNTQGAAACYSGSDPIKTTYGALAGSWAEFDFENSSNDGWSGFDCSCIVAQEAGLSVPACEMVGAGVTSKIAAGGAVDNAYDLSLKDADGIGGQTSGPLKIEFNVNPN